MTGGNLQTGMTVRSSDGDKLGKIIAFEGENIIIEKGIFFPKDYQAKRADVKEITDDGVYLNWGTELIETHYDEFYGSGSYASETETGDWTNYDRADKNQRMSSDETIPVHEEELRAEKSGMKEVGRVRVHKTVSTHDEHFTVPVRREEVTVERVKASGTGAEAGAFKEGTETFPVSEEEVKITKRPVKREEVRVTTHEKEEQRPVSGSVRKEEVRVDDDSGRR